MSTSDVQAAPKPFVFVVMPIKPEFNRVYKVIKDVAEEVGAYAQRVDDQHYKEDMLARIVTQISTATVIVADMSEKNENVFYEVGYAHALGKHVILLVRDVADIPFDLKHRYHIVYSKSAELKEKLRAKLGWAIEEARKGARKSVVCPIEAHINQQRIAEVGPEPATVIQDKGANPPHDLSVQIRNISGAPLKAPIRHVYLLLQHDALVQPFDGTVATHDGMSAPMFVHHPPVLDRYAQRFRVVMGPIDPPPFGFEGFTIIMTRSKNGFPAAYYLPALLEVLVADGAFQFWFNVLYLQGARSRV